MILRELTIWDLPFLLEVRNDETTRVNLENDSVFTLSECAEWFLDTKPKWYIIEINDDMHLFGCLLIILPKHFILN